MNRQAIVVTGANSGIGLRCCEELLAAGHLVFALDRDLDAVSAIAGGAGEMVTIRCDLLAEAQVAEAFATVARRVDRLDGLVCSAGVLRTGRLVEMSVADFDLVFGVNTRGAWLCAKAATDLLTRSGDEATSGRIVMVASIAAIRPKINGGAYAASKAALAQLTKVLAVELAALGIRVNAVAPATVDTPMIRSAAKDGSGYKPSGLSPIGRIAEPATSSRSSASCSRPNPTTSTACCCPSMPARRRRSSAEPACGAFVAARTLDPPGDRHMRTNQARRVVVTGAADGIGLACCETLRREGWNVVMVDIDGERLAERASRLGAPHHVVDVTDADALSALADALEHRDPELGPIEGLVNSAGIVQKPLPPEHLPLAEYDRVIAVDQRGTYLSCVAFGRHMAARRRGSIVNIASITGMRSVPLHAYGPAKAAVIATGECLAAEWGRPASGSTRSRPDTPSPSASASASRRANAPSNT